MLNFVRYLLSAVCYLALISCAQQQAVPKVAPLATTPALTTTGTAIPSQPAARQPAPTALPRATPVAPTLVPATVVPAPTALPTAAEPTVVAASLPSGYPIASPDRLAGDGFYIRHGFSSENTWYNPGYWHTGEDWYAVEGETAGALVLAIADGSVVYAGSNYPGRVVIVEHTPPDGALLYSLYGHLDFALNVREGESVTRGQVLGTVLRRGDEVPNHLHFELRDFLFRDVVNGDAPRYGFRCGPRCPPGPGYWPIDAPELPVALGWRFPAHAIAAQPPVLPARAVVAAQPLRSALLLYSAPPDGQPQPLGRDLPLTPGTSYRLLAVWSGSAASQASSASAYQVWYQVALPEGGEGWVQALQPWDFETGSDGRPSSLRVDLLPAFDQ